MMNDICLAPLCGTDPRYTDQWFCDIPLSLNWLLREVTRRSGAFPVIALTEEFEAFLGQALPGRFQYLTKTEVLRTNKKRLPAYVLILEDCHAAYRLAFWLRNKPRRADVWLFDSYDGYAEFSYASL